jgi:hypothetical protein
MVTEQVTRSFQNAGCYRAEEWLPELESMEQDGSLAVYVQALRRYYPTSIPPDGHDDGGGAQESRPAAAPADVGLRLVGYMQRCAASLYLSAAFLVSGFRVLFVWCCAHCCRWQGVSRADDNLCITCDSPNEGERAAGAVADVRVRR